MHLYPFLFPTDPLSETMSPRLEAITKTTSNIAVNITLLSGISATNDILRASVQQVLEVWGATLETRLAGGWHGTTVGDISVHRAALALEAGAGDVLLGGDLGWTLDPLHGETAVNVPNDMAMHQPGTWVVGLEADDGVSCDNVSDNTR